MSAEKLNTEDKKSLSPMQMGLAGLAGVVLIGLIGFYSMGGGSPSQPKLPTYEELSNQAFHLSVKYEGDASKLTPDEKSIVNGASKNDPVRFMKTAYQYHLKHPNDANLPPAPKVG